ncbi:hypothetical protein F3Y22_tig00110940pilonHSYRG00308 [Hibiscus syriacus]|uniref:ABC transmembrane type-1 domain-containing protein n=1 Tax=Hibiscus syriacus TaxID=106335 RepID=A0A6A2ZC19_HIBSY|nr:hypothetical protein F3Y22_tig00110940pilonHSYRG00308 [Hibiscus syriacus]
MEEENGNAVENKKMSSNDAGSSVRRKKKVCCWGRHVVDGLGFIGAIADGTVGPVIIYLIGSMFNNVGGANLASAALMFTHNVCQFVGDGVGLSLVPNLIARSATFIGAYITTFLLWRLALVIFPLLLLLIVPSLIYEKFLLNLAMKIRVEYNKANIIAEQAIASIRTIYAFVGENKTTTEFSEALQGSLNWGWNYYIVGTCITVGVLQLGNGLSNLKPLSEACSIAERKTVALVGSSGSGKSTVISLLQRFYDPFGGDILLDGVLINKLQLKWLRSQMGLVSQETTLFATTIKENILFGKDDAGMEEVIETAKASNAHSFICQLPLGYDTQSAPLRWLDSYPRLSIFDSEDEECYSSSGIENSLNNELDSESGEDVCSLGTSSSVKDAKPRVRFEQTRGHKLKMPEVLQNYPRGAESSKEMDEPKIELSRKEDEPRIEEALRVGSIKFISTKASRSQVQEELSLSKEFVEHVHVEKMASETILREGLK